VAKNVKKNLFFYYVLTLNGILCSWAQLKVSLYKHVGLQIQLKLDDEPALLHYQRKDGFDAEDAKQFAEQIGLQFTDKIKRNFSVDNGQKVLDDIKKRLDDNPSLAGLVDIDTEALVSGAMSGVQNIFQQITSKSMKIAERGFAFLEFHKLAEYRSQIILEERSSDIEVSLQDYYVNENILSAGD
jgi:hypothetical protein